MKYPKLKAIKVPIIKNDKRIKINKPYLVYLQDDMGNRWQIIEFQKQWYGLSFDDGWSTGQIGDDESDTSPIILACYQIK